MSVTAIVVIIALPLALLILVYVILIGILRRQLAQVRQDWLAQGLTFIRPPESANYRGHLSQAIPVRGNGVLALTTTDLRFAQLVPRREYVIPLDQITRVVIRRTWKGSYRGGQPVIGVYFRDGDQEDALGVIVRGRERAAWVQAIADAAGVPTVDETDSASSQR